jgi:hypothetical protein
MEWQRGQANWPGALAVPHCIHALAL